MATINLGNIKFKWQGAYNGATAYTVDDVVSYNGSSYICIANSTGNLPTNTSYFEQMSSAGTNGTNGTDLTTTLTTQGDLVYRDGSGLQRLGAGTAGQVLQTGGAGANPSWGTVSSDWVKLVSVDQTTAVSSIDFDNVFSSTYSNYILNAEVYGLSAPHQFYFGWRNSGADVITNNWFEAMIYLVRAGAVTTNQRSNSPYYNITAYDADTPVNLRHIYTLDIFDPSDTSGYKSVKSHSSYYTSSGEPAIDIAGGLFTGSTTGFDGFKLKSDGTQTWKAKVYLYGKKK